MKSISAASFAGSLVLAGLAGFVDAIGFVLSGGLFVSFMSGNSTQAGVEASSGELTTAGVALSLVAAFVAGVVLGRVMSLRIRGANLGVRIMGLGVALFAATGAVALWPDPGYSLASLALVMGAMNTLFVADGRARVAITYATGTLVSLGLGIADRLAGGGRTPWVRPLLLWAAITAGALSGALVWRIIGIWALPVAAVGLLLVGVAQLARTRYSRRHGGGGAGGVERG